MKLRKAFVTLGFGLMLTAAVSTKTVLNPGIAYAAEAVTIDETAFPDETFREIVKENFDTDENGVLSSDEIAAVEEIYCDEKDISDLKGIEYFTELTLLKCNDNKLTKLDVSKNTKLVQLYCSANKLTKLDVSDLAALTYLSCNHNKLAKLDVSKNKELKKLYCVGNKMTKLNVSGATALKRLYCGRNKLTKLNVSKNKELTELQCNHNRLTKLNVSKNKKLESLYCDATVKVTK